MALEMQVSRSPDGVRYTSQRTFTDPMEGPVMGGERGAWIRQRQTGTTTGLRSGQAGAWGKGEVGTDL